VPISCPVCAKKNDAGGSCTRCGCDLSSLRLVLSAATSFLSLASRELQKRDWNAALGHAQRSWELAHSPESARLASLAAAALGEIELLKQWRRRAMSFQPASK
jgi:hypothetical protein